MLQHSPSFLNLRLSMDKIWSIKLHSDIIPDGLWYFTWFYNLDDFMLILHLFEKQQFLQKRYKTKTKKGKNFSFKIRIQSNYIIASISVL